MDSVDPKVVSGTINGRLDRLPMTRHMWTLLMLIAAGGLFEQYDIYFTGYIAPGLFQSKLLTSTTASFFDLNGLAAFLGSLFLGLFIGTICFSYIADRFGRRVVFLGSMIWYSVTTFILAFQGSVHGLEIWRLIGGIGIGVEMITIDTYISELAPRGARGKAFALFYGLAQISAPLVAFLAWMFVPTRPFGFDGWRWVILFGSFGAVLVLFLRRRLPESPRWLAQHGRLAEADRVLSVIEAKVQKEYGQALPEPEKAVGTVHPEGRIAEMFGPVYRTRTIMLMIVNFCQTIGYYGFVSWIPTLLIAKGILVTRSLEYTFLIVLTYPVAPLLVMLVIDRFERKWQLVCSVISVAIIGAIFAMLNAPGWLIMVGCLQTLVVNWMSTIVHAYQSELFPTWMRARAVGFVFSWSRLSSIFAGFFIAFFLREFGQAGVFAFIGGAMAIIATTVAWLGPRVTGRALEEIAH
ncbi:MFS transporter [Caballeronia sp. HLA56]